MPPLGQELLWSSVPVDIDRAHHLVLRLHADEARLALKQHRRRGLADRTLHAGTAHEALDRPVLQHHGLGAGLGRGRVLGADHGRDAEALAGLP